MTSRLTRISYSGSPPTLATTSTIFDTVAAACPRNWGPSMGLHSFHCNIKHDQDGTIKGYRSTNGGTTWVQFYDSGLITAPAATTATDKVVLVEGYRDFKFEWVNGGVTQGAGWSVSMDVSIFP